MTTPVTPLRAKAPFLVAAFASFLLSVSLYFLADQKTAGIFVGLWVPSILSLGTLMLSPTPQPVPVPSREARS